MLGISEVYRVEVVSRLYRSKVELGVLIGRMRLGEGCRVVKVC
jgi:hypothetical protein